MLYGNGKLKGRSMNTKPHHGKVVSGVSVIIAFRLRSWSFCVANNNLTLKLTINVIGHHIIN